MMNSLPRENALTYLQTHHVLSLATVGPDGLWSAALFYVNSGFTLYFLSAPTSRHSLNLAVNPAVSATIQADYRDWPEIKGIQLEGWVSRLAGPEQLKAIALYAVKFPVINQLEQAPEIAGAMKKIGWYKLCPSRLYFVDNARGFAHRDEIPL